MAGTLDEFDGTDIAPGAVNARVAVDIDGDGRTRQWVEERARRIIDLIEKWSPMKRGDGPGQVGKVAQDSERWSGRRPR